MSFRYKIALSIFLLEAVVMLAVLWQSLSYLEERLSEQIDLSNKMFVAQLREFAVKEALLTEDFAQIQFQLERIDPSSEFVEIIVFNNQGVILASSSTESLGKNFNDLANEGSWQVDEVLGASGILGKLGYRIDNSHKNATGGALTFGLGLALTGMLVIAAVGTLIGTVLTRRLESIANSLSSIREGVVENFEVDESKDEIGQLSRFVHDMGKSVSSKMNKLSDIEEHTRFALQSAGAGAWRWDMVTKRLFWSAKNFQLLGFLPNKNKPSIRLWRSMVHPDDTKKVDKAINELTTKQKDLDVEYRIIRRSGEIRWMRSVGRLYFDYNEKPAEVYGLQIDITEYKNIEYSMLDQLDILKKMLDFGSEALITLGSRQEILFNNAAALYLFGYERGELNGKPFAHLLGAEDEQKLAVLSGEDMHSTEQFPDGILNVTGVTKSGDTLALQLKYQCYANSQSYQRVILYISNATFVDKPS